MTRTIHCSLVICLLALSGMASPDALHAQATKGTTYGPVQRTQTKSAAGGQSPVRRASGDEPVREPLPGGSNPGGAAAGPKAGPSRPVTPLIQPLVQNGAPSQPAWFPLADDVQGWVDEVLLAWEKTSEEIVTFKCNFKRWEHDPAFGPANSKIPYTYGEGIIQYAKPDKGMFKVEKLLKYSAPPLPGGKPVWTNQIGEQWVCDGRSIFEFNIREKRVIQRILPKEIQGKAIADGPLPFMFGAKVATIKARYWVRPVPDPPKDRVGEYWLEAIPRFPQDAANFQQVSIILDEKDFLPKALDVYAPNYDKKANPAHTEYSFDKRETTLKGDKKLLNLDFLNVFKKEFYEPKVPSGWKKVVEDMNDMPQGPPPVQGPIPGTAKRPGATKTK